MSRFGSTAPGPGTGDGKAFRMTLTCRDCGFTIRASPIVATLAGSQHAELTTHTVLYRGVPQVFTPRIPLNLEE